MSSLYHLYPWENPLNTLRVLACLGILGYACVTDWRSRRAPNKLWYALGGIGLALDAFELWQLHFSVSFLVWLAAGVLFIYVLVYLIFRVGGFGGADAKALIAIAIVFPTYPVLNMGGTYLPLVAGRVMSPAFALTVLGNAVVIMIIAPLSIVIYNLLTVPVRELRANPLGAITGYKVDIGRIKGKHLRLMHRYEEVEGKIIRRMAFRGSEPDDETLARLARWKVEGRIDGKLWVTPKLPFLIPITIGFLVGILYGDLLMQIVAALMGR